MVDLIERLKAAISTVAETAQAASRGPWDHDPDGIAEWSVYGAGGWMVASATAYDGGIARMPDPRSNRKHPPERVNSVANAAHIALNDPAWVLRACEADLRMVNRHQPDDVIGNECAYCVQVHWPCPDLLDTAARYGITEEGA